MMDALIVAAKITVPAYLAIAAFTYLYQDSLIFIAQPRSEAEMQAVRLRHPAAEEVRIDAGDGVRLRGWFLKSSSLPPGRRAPTLVYYGGNAEEVSGHLDEAGRFEGFSLLFVNYRGYGASDGKPGEAVMLADALRVYDHAAARDDVDSGRMVIMGRSLGTGIAVHVAARRPARAVLLVSPYDSMAEVGSRHHPWLPVSLLLRHRFEAIADAPRVKAPMLALVARGDEVVPVENSRALTRAWGGPWQLHEIAGASHNLFGASPDYWRSIAAFLAEVRAANRD